jgi:hypothetical protein
VGVIWHLDVGALERRGGVPTLCPGGGRPGHGRTAPLPPEHPSGRMTVCDGAGVGTSRPTLGRFPYRRAIHQASGSELLGPALPPVQVTEAGLTPTPISGAVLRTSRGPEPWAWD